MMRKTNLIFLTIIIFSSSVLAIAISPPEMNIVYEPGKEIGCGFNFKLESDSKINYRIEGDLNNSIELSLPNGNLNNNEWYSTICKMTLPEDLSPGYHEASIIVVESQNPGGIGAMAGIIFPIRIFIPYPGKYLEIQKYSFNNIAVNETAEFILNVISRGDEKIDSAVALIKLKNSSGSVFGSTQSDSISLEKNQGGELKSKWNSIGTAAGIYEAQATLFYDEKEAKESKEIKVGDLRIDITNINYGTILTENVAKFDVELKSVWNMPIKEAFLTLDIYKNDQIIKHIRSENFDIDSWASIERSVFWETKGVQPGKYKGNFTVFHSEGKASEKSIEFEITENLLGKYPIITIALIIIVVILIILLIINIRKKKNYENK